MKIQFKIISTGAIVIAMLMNGCGGSSEQKSSTGETETEASTTVDSNDPMNNKGIGPVKSITLGPLDQAMADEGQKIFQEKCSACHKPEEKFIGPAPKGIMDRRSPEWIMNMILSPDKMVMEDPIAKQLLMDYNLAPMANQHLTEDQARKILEYFRTLK
jgi:mono/diheme cytochrome c family protein